MLNARRLLQPALLATSMVMVLAPTTGCDDSQTRPPISVGPGSNDGGSGGGGGAEPDVNVAEELFRGLEEDFLNNCSGCHEQNKSDTGFLGAKDEGVDPYTAIKTFDFIIKKAEDSKLLKWPASGNHSGGPTSPDLAARLLTWLEEEAKALPDVTEETKPTTPPFTPVLGFNAVYLDGIDSAFAGMALTFTAEEVTDQSLSLHNIEVHPTNSLGLKIKHPLLSVYDPKSSKAIPDPIDSFSNVEATFEAGQTGQLGPGTVILTNWISGGKLSIAFDALETVTPSDDDPIGACKDLQSFIDNARDELQTRCGNCHGGGNTTATNAVDMSGLQNDTESACAQLLNRVDVTNPELSQLFVTTDPGSNATHPFKFNGNAGQFNNFVSTLTTWIEQEGS